MLYDVAIKKKLVHIKNIYTLKFFLNREIEVSKK